MSAIKNKKSPKYIYGSDYDKIETFEKEFNRQKQCFAFLISMNGERMVEERPNFWNKETYDLILKQDDKFNKDAKEIEGMNRYVVMICINDPESDNDCYMIYSKDMKTLKKTLKKMQDEKLEKLFNMKASKRLAEKIYNRKAKHIYKTS